jgi:two-component SAPR family response regulator
VEAFEQNVSEARKLESEALGRVVRHLQRAADLYGGDFLENLAYVEWAMERQEELRRTYGEALLLLERLLFVRSRYAGAADAYQKLISHDRFGEEAYRELTRCHVALGSAVGH